MKKFIWKLFQIGVGIFLVFHVYALALKIVPVPGTVLMMQRAMGGEEIRRDWTPLKDISPHIVDAVIGGEDGRFCEHNGIDFSAIEQALEDNQEGGKRRGGSTITQQTAKNVFFWNGGGYARKAGEAWMASFIDFIWGKRRTMEVYLNVAEWGDGIFGIEAASQVRFGKPASALTQQEAALLAAVLPSPNKWRVDPAGPYVQGRAGTLRKRMRVVRDNGYSACVTGQASYPAARKRVPETVTPLEDAPDTEIREKPTAKPETVPNEPNNDSEQPSPETPSSETQDTGTAGLEGGEVRPDAPEQSQVPAPESEVPPSKIETPTLSEVDIMEMDTGDKTPPEPEEQ